MSKNVPDKVIDVTGVELTPAEPDVCLGNGKQGFAHCCDECDYFLLCFPELYPDRERAKELLLEKNEVLEERRRKRGKGH